MGLLWNQEGHKPPLKQADVQYIVTIFTGLCYVYVFSINSHMHSEKCLVHPVGASFTPVLTGNPPQRFWQLRNVITGQRWIIESATPPL